MYFIHIWQVNAKMLIHEYYIFGLNYYWYHVSYCYCRLVIFCCTIVHYNDIYFTNISSTLCF